jgi:aminoacylase
LFTESSIEWIRKQAEEIGLEYNIKEFEPPALFVIWLTWKGKDPSLDSIFLNSHIDVVPVDEVRKTVISYCSDKFALTLNFVSGKMDA